MSTSGSFPPGALRTDMMVAKIVSASAPGTNSKLEPRSAVVAIDFVGGETINIVSIELGFNF